MSTMLSGRTPTLRSATAPARSSDKSFSTPDSKRPWGPYAPAQLDREGSDLVEPSSWLRHIASA